MLGPGEELIYSREWNLTDEFYDPVPPGIYQLKAIIKASSTIESEPLDIEVHGYQQDILLYKGWNFVSLPCVPVNSDLSIVLKYIWPFCKSVWSYNAGSRSCVRYTAGGPYYLNNLKDMNIGKGYWIEVSQDVILNIVGRFITDPAISLKSGWNYVGFNSATPLLLDQAMSSISYNSIHTYSSIEGKWLGQTPAGLQFLNGLTCLEPGKGYCIHVNADCMWDIRNSGL